MLIFLNCLLETSFKGYLACWTQIKLGNKKSLFGMKIIQSILSQIQIQWKLILKLDFHLLFSVHLSVFSPLTKSL